MDNEISSLIFKTEKNPLKIKKCPYCESVFIDDNQCEACGSHFGKVNTLSFYDIKNNYIDSVPSYKRVYGIFPRDRHFRKYIFSVKNRQKYLLRSFNFDFSAISFYEDSDDKRYKNFIELKCIIEELVSLKIPNSELEIEARKYPNIPYIQEAMKYKILCENEAKLSSGMQKLYFGILTKKQIIRIFLFSIILFFIFYLSSLVNWSLLAI